MFKMVEKQQNCCLWLLEDHLNKIIFFDCSHTKSTSGMMCGCLMDGTKRTWTRFESSVTALASNTRTRLVASLLMSSSARRFSGHHARDRWRPHTFRSPSPNRSSTAAAPTGGSSAPCRLLSTRSPDTSTGSTCDEKREFPSSVRFYNSSEKKLEVLLDFLKGLW